MTEHTPEPWETDGRYIWGVDGSLIAKVTQMSDSINPNIAKCNADLLAGAPELLAALNRLYYCLEDFMSVHPMVSQSDEVLMYHAKLNLKSARVARYKALGCVQ